MSNPLLATTGLPKFDAIKPHHAVPALETLITAHKRRLDTLLAANHTTKFESIIEPIEDMYHELNRIWSPISHLQSVLDSVEWREVYNKSLPLITKHSTNLLRIGSYTTHTNWFLIRFQHRPQNKNLRFSTRN